MSNEEEEVFEASKEQGSEYEQLPKPHISPASSALPSTVEDPRVCYHCSSICQDGKANDTQHRRKSCIYKLGTQKYKLS